MSLKRSDVKHCLWSVESARCADTDAMDCWLAEFPTQHQ